MVAGTDFLFKAKFARTGSSLSQRSLAASPDKPWLRRLGITFPPCITMTVAVEGTELQIQFDSERYVVCAPAGPLKRQWGQDVFSGGPWVKTGDKPRWIENESGRQVSYPGC